MHKNYLKKTFYDYSVLLVISFSALALIGRKYSRGRFMSVFFNSFIFMIPRFVSKGTGAAKIMLLLLVQTLFTSGLNFVVRKLSKDELTPLSRPGS